MTTQHNKQTAAEFFTRFSAGDIPGAVGLLSADATWWIAGDLVALEVESHGELANGRVYHNEYHTLWLEPESVPRPE